jgi:hypothetical protein
MQRSSDKVGTLAAALAKAQSEIAKEPVPEICTGR